MGGETNIGQEGEFMYFVENRWGPIEVWFHIAKVNPNYSVVEQIDELERFTLSSDLETVCLTL